MKAGEKLVAQESNYFVYFPSQAAKSAFLYPVCTGHYIYEPGYSLQRNSYDSFLIMYIKSGKLTVEYEDRKESVNAGKFVILDCYIPHAYYSEVGWESVWCHFDGPQARAYFEMVTGHLGHVFTLSEPYGVINKMKAIYHTFESGEGVKEPLLCKQLTDILTAFLLYAPSRSSQEKHADMIEEIASYVHEHFAEGISVKELADKAMMSQYHFIRVFKKVTSYTPYEYILNMRINTAKYLLATTELPVKDICFNAGFSSESVFCAGFKKNVGLTPAEYRNSSASDAEYACI